MEKDLKVVFLPGCFDNFDGTQEELDELIAEIHASIEDGSFLEDSVDIDLDQEDALDDLPPEMIQQLSDFFDAMDEGKSPADALLHRKKNLN